MAIDVLRSQDLRVDRVCGHALLPPLLKSPPNSNPKPDTNPNPNPRSHPRSHPRSSPNLNHNTSTKSRRRKRSPGLQDRASAPAKSPGASLLMGRVTILKRGEKLNRDGVSGVRLQDDGEVKAKKKEKHLDLCSTERFGPDPETVKQQVRFPELNSVDFGFAGPGNVESPPPTSLPIPAFILNNDPATSGLRKLLRLDPLSK